MTAVAQQGDPLFFNIENAIRHNEPEWTLMDRYLPKEGQLIGLRWRLDQQEIFALIIVEPSTALAIRFFEDDGLGAAPAKTPRRNLEIGDGCIYDKADVTLWWF
jgi:hypothetical protein